MHARPHFGIQILLYVVNADEAWRADKHEHNNKWLKNFYCRVAPTELISPSKTGKEQTTAPGTSCPTLYDECVGSLKSPADHNSEDAGDGVYVLSSLSEKTSSSNNLQMSLQRQYILLSYFRILSVGPVSLGARTRKSALPTELTARLYNI